MKKHNHTKLYIILLILALSSFLFDNMFLELFSKIHNRVFDLLFGFASNIMVLAIFIASLSIFIFILKKDRHLVFLFYIILFSNICMTYFFKFLFQRSRPQDVEIVLHGFSDYSFPSSHSSVLFSILPFLLKTFPRQKFVWIALSVLVVLSRLYLGVHYFSDVIFGSILGYAVGNYIFYSYINKK